MNDIASVTEQINNQDGDIQTKRRGRPKGSVNKTSCGKKRGGLRIVDSSKIQKAIDSLEDIKNSVKAITAISKKIKKIEKALKNIR